MRREAIGILLTVVIILGGGFLFTWYVPIYHYQYFISFNFNKQGEDILRVGNATPILDHPIKSIADINNIQSAFEKQEKWDNLTIISVTKL